MKGKKNLLLLALLSVVLASCGVFQKTRKNELEDGFYSQSSESGRQQVYVDNGETLIKVYPVNTINRIKTVDTSSSNIYGIEMVPGSEISFQKTSFDLDVITIPLKFRPGQSELPAQLNTNLNGALFTGFRIDRYYISSAKTPAGLTASERQINHFAISFGLFSGIGNTHISSSTTTNPFQQEYDGIIWSNGIASIIGVNNFTVGLAVGFDHLLDKNRRFWIYQGKPWVGLSFGLNLN